MERTPNRIITGFLLVGALACSDAPDTQQPPSGSYSTKTLHVGIGGALATVRGASVIPGFFRVAHVPIALGRQFVEADHDSTSANVAILSFELWKERFGSSATVLGRAIDIDGVPATIVGVTSAGYRFGDSISVWLPGRR
ncbi:MAG: ABC transporter permease [bacterium]